MRKKLLFSALLFVTGGAFSQSLTEVLCHLNANFGNVTALVPTIYNFTYDGGANYIGDGGSDMYDGGNYLNTDLSSGIAYSDNVIAPHTGFGTTGQYFTRHLSGLFVMAADLDNVNTFAISGNNGADGSGTADEHVFTTVSGGVTYNVFVKRVYNAWDPSINHVMIIPENASASHTWATNTDNDQHDLTGLASTTRIYYLLYASASGGFVDNPTTEAIVQEFLDGIVLAATPVDATASATLICGSDPLTLTAIGGADYVWDNGVTDGVTFNPSPGTVMYHVTSTPANGCAASIDSIQVAVGALPTVTANPDATLYCDGDMVTLTASGSATIYTWDNGVTDGVPFSQAVGTMTYILTGTDAAGCTDYDTIDVTVNANPSITLSTSDELFGNDGSVNLTITAGVAPFTFDWDNDGTGDNDDSNDLNGVAGGTYTVIMTDGTGCSTTASATVGTQLGVDEQEVIFAAYPNPTSGELNLVWEGEFTYTLSNILGESLFNGIAVNQEAIDLSAYAAGSYFLTVKANGYQQTMKIVKR